MLLQNIVFVKPDEEYIRRYMRSFWEAFDYIARERKYLAIVSAYPPAVVDKFIRDTIQNNIPYLAVIDTKLDRAVGWCDAQPRCRTVGYLGVGLLPEYREKGIGRKLITKVLELSSSYGYKAVELEARQTNRRAIHLYESLGFRKTGIVRDGFRVEDMIEDIVKMRKIL